MIDDRMEEGSTEEEVVSEIGNVDDIVSQIIADTPLVKLVKEKAKPNRMLKAWEIVLLVLGSPLWVSLLLAVIAVIGILFVMGMNGKKWDFAKLSTNKYETNTYQISEDFNHISMELKTADVFFEPSTDGMCKVVCYESFCFNW